MDVRAGFFLPQGGCVDAPAVYEVRISMSFDFMVFSVNFINSFNSAILREELPGES